MSDVINKQCSIRMLEIDGLKFVVADDFLNDPDDFTRYAEELSRRPVRHDNDLGFELYPPIPEFDQRYPDYRRDLTRFVVATVGTTTRNAYGLDDSYSQIGIYKGPLFNCVYKLPAFTPHVDPGHISSFIYLNKGDMCSGGTGVYRHRPTGRLQFVQPHTSLAHVEREPLTSQLNYSAGEWELLHKFEMRYNRFIAFTSSVVHKIFFEPEGHPYGEHINQVRLSLNAFFVFLRPQS
jgi:hypothetical protein